MKKLAFIILGATILLLGCSKSDDLLTGCDEPQLKSADNRSEQFYVPGSSENSYTPIICDGEEVDHLIGNENSMALFIIHFTNGEAVWARGIFNGTLESAETGEIFTMHEINKFDIDENGIKNWTCHTNAVGDRGTHLILRVNIMELDEWEVVKAMCVPNGKDK